MTKPPHTASDGAPKHCIEVEYKGATYRYYGWKHVKNARCLGEGDWRSVADGKEYKTWGAIIPREVLRLVAEECEKQEVVSDPR